MRTWCLVLLVVAGCQDKKSDTKTTSTAAWRATCEPVATNDAVECKLTNGSTEKGTACVTARVWVPEKPALVAQRICAAVDPGETKTLMPKFERLESLQPVCSPNGTWICKAEVVETPEMLNDNIAKPKANQ